MKYLFTNKEVKVGNVCVVLCNKEQLKAFKFQKYFPKLDLQLCDMNRFGIKVVNVSETKIQGYMVYQTKSEPKILHPYIYNNKPIYMNITNSNCVGLLKYK